MRTVDYSDVLQGSLALAGIPFADLDTADPEFALFRTFHDRRLRIAWEIHRWPEVCRHERRSFRAPWNVATTYAAGAEVLDLVSLQYFQALLASTGEAPTTGGVTNDVYWALSQASYAADDYSPATRYELGDQVRNPADGWYYQAFAGSPMRVSGAGVVDFNADYLAVPGLLNGKSYYTTGSFYGYGIQWDGTHWALIYNSTSLPAYYSDSDVATPDLATGWYSVTTAGVPDPANNPPPTVAAYTPTTLNPLAWAVLTPFQRYVAYEQTDLNGDALTPIAEVLAAYDRDPRVTTRNTKRPFTVTRDGFAFTTASAYVWLHYRLRRPTLTGAPWDATLVYTSGRQVYYADTTTGVGNFYTANATTSAGESPASAPTKWDVVEIPYLFREYLAQGGYVDWLTSDGQGDKAAAGEGQCVGLLELEADKLQRQQQQVNRLDWL